MRDGPIATLSVVDIPVLLLQSNLLFVPHQVKHQQLCLLNSTGVVSAMPWTSTLFLYLTDGLGSARTISPVKMSHPDTAMQLESKTISIRVNTALE